jgi:hypothetical protein
MIGSNAKLVTVADAEQYFGTQLSSRAWEAASSSEKDKALIEASRLISALSFSGSKTVSTQDLAFPRNGATVIPNQIQMACAELALALLNGFDPETEIRNLRLSSEGFMGARSTYNQALVPRHLVNGIVSAKAWGLIRPYLSDPNAIAICRAS